MRESELDREGTLVMRVSALTVDPLTTLPVVVLRDEHGAYALTVGVGLGDAAAIATELDGIELERPMTHQLMAEMLAKVGATVDCVVLGPGPGDQYTATVHLRMSCGGAVTQDARPSDAFALALRVGADIRVCMSAVESRHVGDAWIGAPAGSGGAMAPACSSALLGDDSADLLERLADESFGKWKI